MNPYNFAALFFAFCTFLVGILIWFRRQDKMGNIYLFFSFFVTIWGVGYSIMISPNVSYENALLATRISQGLSMFIPATWYHVILIFTGRMNSKKKKFLIFLYLFSISTNFFSFSKFYISKLEPAVGFNFFTRPGLLYHFYPFLYFSIVPLGFYELIQKMKCVSGKERMQFLGFFFATLFGFVGGSFCFLPVYEIMVPQYGLFIMPIYPFIMAYFMMRHHLFDLEELAKVFQREKLATLGLLAASINHEIRNPLYAVKSLLETQIENTKEGLPTKEPLQTSEKALNQIKRALDVITKLNRFAKPASDVPSTQSASIPEAVQNVLDLVSYEFSLDQIIINNQIPKDLPPIQADPRQLEEILFNLIVNACHAMKGKGGTLAVRSMSHEPRITLTLSDTGSGISPDQAKHLFEPFHTTKGEHGTGLGLYITKQLVERNGGKIYVQSKEGKGTTFSLEFPSAQPLY